MKPISLEQIKTLRTAKQNFSDCYLVSSIGALCQSKNGIKILRKNIFEDCGDYKIKFQNIDGCAEDFFVSKQECDDLILLNKFMVPKTLDAPHNPIIKAIEIAMNKLIEKYPSKKSLFNKLVQCQEKFEYNNPSRFLEMFTGKKPIVLNESGIKMSLKSKKQDAIDILRRIAKNKNSSFVCGTGCCIPPNGLTSWHCYTINSAGEKLNPFKLNDPSLLKRLGINFNYRGEKTETVTIYDHRYQKEIDLPFYTAIQKLKFIVGYFNKDLK